MPLIVLLHNSLKNKSLILIVLAKNYKKSTSISLLVLIKVQTNTSDNSLKKKNFKNPPHIQINVSHSPCK